ncbi:hypothetical protein NDU88_005568 [Pleurodeles waltl]|uniref:Uncharacterized protein n=1 Tax=Pleurodeles waltl TaxID=8319 RepID=A0AAV7W868_PLEWA|nr:hypothetical protein NDU88_005568 [Pleurodeles waltl]
MSCVSLLLLCDFKKTELIHKMFWPSGCVKAQQALRKAVVPKCVCLQEQENQFAYYPTKGDSRIKYPFFDTPEETRDWLEQNFPVSRK